MYNLIVFFEKYKYDCGLYFLVLRIMLIFLLKRIKINSILMFFNYKRINLINLNDIFIFIFIRDVE